MVQPYTRFERLMVVNGMYLLGLMKQHSASSRDTREQIYISTVSPDRQNLEAGQVNACVLQEGL